MDDGDHEGLHTALHSDPRFIVATALATLVMAGSALIWRSNPRNNAGNSHNQLGESACKDPDYTVTTDNKRPGPETSKSAGTGSKGSTAGKAIVVRDELGDESETKDLKASRPKERRRRGKDPMKDLLKNVKKTKLLAKPSRTGDFEDNGPGQPNALPKVNEVTRHSRKASKATSSRSISSASNRRSPIPSQVRASPYPTSNPGSHTGDGDDEDEEDTPLAAFSSTLPTPNSNARGLQSQSSSLAPPDFHSSDTSSSILVSDLSRTDVSPNIPPSSSSASRSTSTHSSDSVISPNTSPTISQSGKTPTLAQVSIPPHASSQRIMTSTSSPSVQQTQQAPGPWDWDRAGATPDGTYHKPPRFRSKSRGSGPISMSPSIPASVSLDNYPSDLPSFSSSVNSPTASTTFPSESAIFHEDLPPSFTFPSPDTFAKPASSSPISLGPSHGANGAHPNANGSSNTPRRAPTPRRPPTPLSGTGTPSPTLSTQTQLASLRGALEAARLREEKMKVDTERYSKELEMMRWESATWRRREAELQSQVHHLMHQLQTYSALFASMSGQPSPLPQHHMPPAGSNPNGNGSSNPGQNGYPFSPSSNPHSPPPHLHIPSAQMLLGSGVLSSSMLSPMAMALNSPHSPFYPFPSHAHPLVQQQAQPPLQQSNNVYSMMFPHPTNPAAPGSGPSSVAGSSSVGSHSPDLAGPSPTPPSTSYERGRRRTRTRTQTAGPRVGERGSGGTWDGEGSDGWVVGDDEIPANRDGEDSYDSEEEGSVSEVLADAILKRPGSIRGLSKRGKTKEKGEREREVQHTEFTFPSLSDFGNVNRSNGVPAVPVDGEDSGEITTDKIMNTTQAEEVPETPQPVAADQPASTFDDVLQETLS